MRYYEEYAPLGRLTLRLMQSLSESTLQFWLINAYRKILGVLIYNGFGGPAAAWSVLCILITSAIGASEDLISKFGDEYAGVSSFVKLSLTKLMGLVEHLTAFRNSLEYEHPSQYWELLLIPLLPKPKRERLIDDLREEYEFDIYPEDGVRAAQRWYRDQILHSVRSLMGPALRRFIVTVVLRRVK